VPKEQQDSEDHKDQMVLLVLREILVLKVIQVPKVLQVIQVLRELQGQQVPEDLKEL
jgi:hypothetical protein